MALLAIDRSLQVIAECLTSQIGMIIVALESPRLPGLSQAWLDSAKG